ncbi:alpha/beta fold hydrolase (macronuclear) [Tetrahymena thermophila SB210]|uniref:Alpha/beta fold hydrolase n=1 Tax=Tetrahymena thermophila (strain SB210) TaxID=312017 RepID=I7MEY0_TETTS|nr:alpha/beta fold hydrolase [Tetrahymena thermophila SB210]EAR98011.1 alpha/beta fold hydrolase [Tetrahymena thermophila SB210]|eukprot:XP_001018256.1 alpha/beta fold hydrolase [Tetrahymena thermophila SB210]
MDFFKSISDKYAQFWKNIIEPQRQQYSLSDLGSNVRILHSIAVIRKDVQVLNDRGEQLECTYFLPDNMIKEKKLPIVIYLHGNSGSRVEAVSTLQHLIPTFGLFCFDFSGSGKSQGKYVTMGVNECRDLESIVQYVQNNLTQSEIIIWGRSMGAVTGILYAQKNQSKIQGLVLDSPFSDLKKVMLEIASSKTKIPSLIVDGVISLMKSQIQEALNGVDIFNTQIEEKIKNLQIPILFAYGTNDNIILPYHSQVLYKACRSDDKCIIEFEGNHNTIRPNQFFQKIVQFIQLNCISRPQIKQLNQITTANQPDISNKNTQLNSFNINSNSFYNNSKPNTHLQSLPSDDNVYENKQNNQQKSQQFYQNIKKQIPFTQKQYQNLSIDQNNQKKVDPEFNYQFNQIKNTRAVAGHTKSNSLSGQIQQRGISLISYQQKNTEQQINAHQIQIRQDSLFKDSQQQQQQIDKKLDQNHFENKMTPKPARKKIFQDAYSERKQSKNHQQNQGLNIFQSHNQFKEQSDKMIDNTEQYISNQLNLLQQIANENIIIQKPPISNAYKNSNQTKSPVNNLVRSPSSSALSPTVKLQIPDCQQHINFSRGTNFQNVQNSQLQITPFLVESQNIQQVHSSQEFRKNNFQEKQFCSPQQQQQQQQQQEQQQQQQFPEQASKVKKFSNQCGRQYSLDFVNSSNKDNLSEKAKDLQEYYQYGIVYYHKNDSKKGITSNSKISSQLLQNTNSTNENIIQDQSQPVDRNFQQLAQPSINKFDNQSDYYTQAIPNFGSAFDWNNSSLDGNNFSYLNPTRNPFQNQEIQSQQQQKNNQYQEIIKSQNNCVKQNNNQQQSAKEIQILQQQTQLFKSDNTTDHSNKCQQQGYLMQNINSPSKFDKHTIIENQINVLREAENQDRIQRLNSRSRNASIANEAIKVTNRNFNLENSIPKQQELFKENKNIQINIPQQGVTQIQQQQYHQNSRHQFNLVLSQQQPNINNQVIQKDRQTLSPLNRNFVPNISNVISSTIYNSSQGQKNAQNYTQKIVQSQNNILPPYSPVRVVLSHPTNQNNENLQRRYSGVENVEKVQFVSVFTQNLQNRTQRGEYDLHQKSQRTQVKYSEQYPQIQIVNQPQQQQSLYHKVLGELQTNQINQISDLNQGNLQQKAKEINYSNKQYGISNKLPYESVSINQQIQTTYEASDKQKYPNLDTQLPISHQQQSQPKQIQLHTNHSNDDAIQYID